MSVQGFWTAEERKKIEERIWEKAREEYEVKKQASKQAAKQTNGISCPFLWTPVYLFSFFYFIAADQASIQASRLAEISSGESTAGWVGACEYFTNASGRVAF